jgi:hypothetical protein
MSRYLLTICRKKKNVILTLENLFLRNMNKQADEFSRRVMRSRSKNRKRLTNDYDSFYDSSKLMHCCIENTRL